MNFIRQLAFCFSFSFLVLLAPSSTLAEGKPNIIFLLADDLGWNDIGYHGSEIKTPALDKLAASGAKLEQFYVMPVCTPTRASFMTGRYPIRYGLQRGVILIDSLYGLSLDERTLPQALKEAGYRTAITGKWHLGHYDSKYFPQNRGFDYQYGMYWGRINYFTHEVDQPPHEPGLGLDWHRQGKALREEGYSTTLIGREVAHILDEHDKSKPLFLYMPFNCPHSPVMADPKFVGPYADIKNTKRRGYCAMVAALDDAVSNIVQAVERNHMSSNTVIFFASDNGGNPGFGGNNFPLHGNKATLYEGGVRVPAFAVSPGKIKPGTVVNEMIHMVDVYPTLVKLAGGSLQQPKPLDGVDAWPTIAEGKSSLRHEMLINSANGQGAIRFDNWKLIAGLNGPNSIQLYNLAEDPNEKSDLSKQEPARVKELKARLDAYTAQAASPLKTDANTAKNYVLPKVIGE